MRKIDKVIFMLIVHLASTNCLAQVENINTDRPDQSDGVYTVPKNKFQLENGITSAKMTLLNEVMLRYGITHTTEIRMVAEIGKELENNGLKPLTFSLKQRILKQKKILPAITFVSYISFEKLASKDFQSTKIPVELKLAFENEMSDKFSLGYNIGTSNFEDLNLTMGLGYASNDKISTFIEYFSTIKKLETEHNIDAGILFSITPQLQVDIAGGRSIFDIDNRFFATIGLSYLFMRN